MNEKDLQFFIDGTKSYFSEVTGLQAQLGIPFVKTGESILLDITGVITISGERRGAIYLTSSVEMLNEIGKILLGVDEVLESDLPDLAGEIANTLSGYVRLAYGESAMISVPTIVKGKADDLYIKMETPIYVIPFIWKSQKAYLVVGIQ
jgi:chemotaxis protein CheX